jgi:uncharacterized repeat protein (TIGR01451 family)
MAERPWRLRAFAEILLIICTTPFAASAQVPPPPPLPAVPPPAPALPIEVRGPAGTEVTFYPIPNVPRTFPAPAAASLRPGYLYRIKLSNLSQDKDAVLYPTLEVIGTLQLPCPTDKCYFPVPVVFTPEDIDQALAGGFLTKLYVLEHPDRAVPVATTPADPLTTEVRPDADLTEEARRIGRPLLVVRFGQRVPEPAELAAWAIPGTILLPGDGRLGPPARPPCLPFQCWQIVDPLAGPKYPEEECLHDGGDAKVPAGFDAGGNLHGLDPADTLAEYVDVQGVKRLAISNRVCVCVPRYAVLRQVVLPSNYLTLLGPRLVRLAEAEVLVRTRTPPLLYKQAEQAELVVARERPAATLHIEGPILLEHLEATPVVLGAIGPKSVVGVSRKECPAPPGPLLLCKKADKECASIGDVVNFSLRYTNSGGQPITDVVVSDSLTGRLEYVPGSNRADRDATFTTQENVAGSVILRWQINGVLAPGQSGLVTFQAKIR